MRSVTILFLGTMFLFLGCGSNPPENSMGDVSANLPDWVLNPKQIEGDDLYGVGIASGIQNKALAIETAENRGIADIARVFRVNIEAMMEDYMRSTTAGEMIDTEEEQDIMNATRTVIDQSLSGVVVTNRFIDPDDGTVYVRVKLDLEMFEDFLNKANAIDAKMKEYIKNNAREAFNKLDSTLEQQRNR